MLLRPYQTRLVQRAVKALGDHGNTLAVAATGAGKTICLSAIAKELDCKTLVIQHRTELVKQNMTKYKAVNPRARVGLWTSSTKTWKGDATFAMVQSLAGHVSKMPKIDLIIADEAHHCAAPTWRKIIDTAREKNPDCMLAGFTATPSRSDRKGLRLYFDNVCDNVTIAELVGMGHLVPPKAFVVDTEGTAAALAKLGHISDVGEQGAVADILNTDPINAEVIRNWRERAAGRPTVVFCATVQHAEDVAKAFTGAGIPAGCVHGQLTPQERQAMLDKMTRGELKVITNVFVLTEGWDYPPVSCVILLRRCSEKGPLIQMVGRGLRTVSASEYPGVVKKDCIVMDFGQSLLTHGDLIADASLGKVRDGEDSVSECTKKICPMEYTKGMEYRFPDSLGQTGCGAELPAQTRVCPLCGFNFEHISGDESTHITHVDLTEMDILTASPFRYIDLFGTDRVLLASGFEVWVGVMTPDDGETWYALGKRRDGAVESISAGSKIQAMAAADDYMRNYETENTATKSRSWLDTPPSDKQVALLNSRFGYDLQPDLLGTCKINKYEAMCHLSFQFSRPAIERTLGVAT